MIDLLTMSVQRPQTLTIAIMPNLAIKGIDRIDPISEIAINLTSWCDTDYRIHAKAVTKDNCVLNFSRRSGGRGFLC